MHESENARLLGRIADRGPIGRQEERTSSGAGSTVKNRMNEEALAGYRFESYCLFLNQRALVREGVSVPLQTRTLNALLLLLQNAPRAVEKAEFMREVWHDAMVEDSNLTVQISILRRALGDSSKKNKFITTVPRKGYRFVARVTPIESIDALGNIHSKPNSRSGSLNCAQNCKRPGGDGETIGMTLKADMHPKKDSGHRVQDSPGRLPTFSIIPAPLTALVGRERELDELRGLLLRSDVRLATLTGTGGSGKTELAQQTAATLTQDFVDGVVFVSLAPISDPSLLAGAIAQAFGIRESGTASLNDVLAESLRRRECLLLLDNFEHMVAAAGFVVWLLQMCPQLTMLVTSRVPLNVRGEHIFPLEPLPLPDDSRELTPQALADCPSAALFLERAKAVSPNFKLTGENASSVIEICVMTGGLPLAIELVARQIRFLSLTAMLASSEGRRLDLFTAGPRDAPERQQTMTKNIDWSYQLLDEDEKTLFARLSVFAGGFTLDLAARVCQPSADRVAIREALTSLLENGLVKCANSAKRDFCSRYEMLETIREYAAERLRSGGEEEIGRRQHAQVFCALVEETEPELIGGGAPAAFDILQKELGNLRAAMQWCQDRGNTERLARIASAMRMFWIFRGSLQEGRRWLEPLLGNHRDLSDQTRAKVFLAAGRLLERSGDHGSAMAALEKGVVLCRRLNDKE